MIGIDHRKQMEQIIGQMECPKDFECYKSGLKNLCKARDTGLESYLECSEEFPETCKFSVPFGNLHFCKCSLRLYIARELRK